MPVVRARSKFSYIVSTVPSIRLIPVLAAQLLHCGHQFNLIPFRFFGGEMAHQSHDCYQSDEPGHETIDTIGTRMYAARSGALQSVVCPISCFGHYLTIVD
jgi:hypothetical protein